MDTQVIVVLAVPQVPLLIHPMSFAAWDSLTVHAEVVQGGPIDPPVDPATIPARRPLAAAWVMVACAPRIRPYEMMP